MEAVLRSRVTGTRRVPGFETGASTIRIYALSVVPGLLQTPEYATHLLKGIPPAKTPEQIRRLIELRARRQDLLHDRNRSTRLITVIDEAALHRLVGSEEEMWAQLDQ